jgi:hypothetical protein
MICSDAGKVTGCRLGSLLRRFQEWVSVCGRNGNGVAAGLESMIPMPRILVHLEQNQPNSGRRKKMRAPFHREGAIGREYRHEWYNARVKTKQKCEGLTLES